MVRHTTTQRWKHWKTVSGAARVKDAPFVLATTATPAHTPLELPYLAPQFAAHHGESIRDWADLPKRLESRTGSTWNVAATAGSGPRTPTSVGPTSPRCRPGSPTPTRRRRCTAPRRGARSR